MKELMSFKTLIMSVLLIYKWNLYSDGFDVVLSHMLFCVSPESPVRLILDDIINFRE